MRSGGALDRLGAAWCLAITLLFLIPILLIIGTYWLLSRLVLAVVVFVAGRLHERAAVYRTRRDIRTIFDGLERVLPRR